MWGANGKNHFGPMGYYWLVACLLLPATVVAQDWEAIESYLNDINYDTGRISTDVGYIRQDMGDVFVLVSDLSDSVDNQTLFVQRIFRFLEDLPTAPDLKYDGTYDARGVRVVSDGVNTRLDKIIELLSNAAFSASSPYIPFDIVTSYGHVPAADPSTSTKRFYQQLMQFYDAYKNGYPTVSGFSYEDFYDQMYWRYGDWKWQLLQTFSVLNNDLLVGASSNTNNYVQMYNKIIAKFAPYERSYYDVYQKSYYQQYSTLPLYLLQSNYLFSAVQNGQTNNSIIAQLISAGETSALFGNGEMSNSLFSVSSLLSDNGLVSTNDTYFGEYTSPSNVSELVDIDTNAWSNSSYSAYVEEFDSESVSNKVSRFDFETFFSDSLDGAIDSIDVSDVGDFVLEFGNLTLGDWFSYTIPSITISRNETYLDFVDKFLLGLKAFATCCFFLVLWRQLRVVT